VTWRDDASLHVLFWYSILFSKFPSFEVLLLRDANLFMIDKGRYHS
jgi:hypothetical protein